MATQVTTSDLGTNGRFSRAIARASGGRVAVIVHNSGGNAHLWSAVSPYTSWTDLGSINLGYGDSTTRVNPALPPVPNPNATNKDYLGFAAGLNDNSAANDAAYSYASFAAGTWTPQASTDWGASWANSNIASLVYTPAGHLWVCWDNAAANADYGAVATNDLYFVLYTTETAPNTAVGTRQFDGPHSGGTQQSEFASLMTYVSGSPATVYAFFNDLSGTTTTDSALRFISFADATTTTTNQLNAPTTYSSPISTGTLAVRAEQFSVTRDSSDGLHVVVKNANGIQYTYKPSGGAWTAATTISGTTAAADSYPKVTTFSNTNVVITWVHNTGTANQQNIVYVSATISSTPSFGSQTAIYTDSGTNNAQYVQCEAVSSTGTDYVVSWQQGTASPWSVQFQLVTPSFGGSTAKTITDSSAAATDALSISTSFTLSDTSGASTEAFTIGMPISDTSGAATDALSITTSFTLSDTSGAATDALSASASFALADTSGATTDSVTVSQGGSSPNVSDTSSAAVDDITVSTSFALADASGAATDALSLAPVTPTVTDTSSAAADALALTLYLTLTDSGGPTTDAVSATTTFQVADTSSAAADGILWTGSMAMSIADASGISASVVMIGGQTTNLVDGTVTALVRSGVTTALVRDATITAKVRDGTVAPAVR